MHLGQYQKQKLVQKLSPQQIQLMKLLQVPTAMLDDRIREELESNPALETGTEEKKDKDDLLSSLSDSQESHDEQSESDTIDDYLEMDLSDYIHDDEPASYNSGMYDSHDDNEDSYTPSVKVEKSFHDHLKEQLGTLNLNTTEYTIALQIIGSIDEDGYLRREPIAISDDLAFKQNLMVSEKEVKRLIKKIQKFEPAGVGAHDLQECLLIQMYRLSDKNPDKSNAIKILEDNFDAFSKKHYSKIKTRLKLSEEDLKNAIELILKLTPKPGTAFSSSGKNHNFIIPDFFIYNNNGELELSLNAQNAPELHISEGYKEMLKSYSKNKERSTKEKEALVFIKQKIDAAKWFIDAIKQRQHTLLLTMDAIMEYQKQFFLSGDEMDLRPMILKDIAEEINMDISTVSRVANSKYVQTEFGVFLLKFFFSESMTTESGEEVSTHEIKSILQEVVNNENKKKPYSDEKLMRILSEKGYNIARRTIAKYREQLSIPVARLRKEV